MVTDILGKWSAPVGCALLVLLLYAAGLDAWRTYRTLRENPRSRRSAAAIHLAVFGGMATLAYVQTCLHRILPLFHG